MKLLLLEIVDDEAGGVGGSSSDYDHGMA